MSLVAAAVCPHPPLLVPEVASGAAPELDDLRAACDLAVGRLLEAEPDELVIVGAGPEPSGATVGRADLPLSQAIGEWLLSRAGEQRQILKAVVVATDAPTAQCAELGRGLTAGAGRVALLVMGDGSACRGPQAPGYDDPRAEAFDAHAAAALGAADTAALLAIDAVLAAELRCAGRAPWQVLAGAAQPGQWRGELRYNAAPYGVAYFVATWTPRP